MTDTISSDVRIGVRRLAGSIGAEITGVDARPAQRRHHRPVRQALLDHKVVFLRDQRLDYASQVAFAERFGPLTLGHPTLSSPPDQPFLEEIDSSKGGTGQPVAHRRHVRRSAAGVHLAARRRDPAGRWRHALGQHRGGYQPCRRT